MSETQRGKAEKGKLTPHEFITRLAENPDHKITDEDFENLDMNVDDEAGTVSKESDKPDQAEPPEQEPPNPYAVLGE